MEAAADPRAEGIVVCAELIREFAAIPGIAGAHIMSPVDASMIPEAVAASGLRG